MRNEPILILGGTRDALSVAALLVADGFDVTTSLAGVTKEPVLPKGKLRIGGFGGEEGLLAYLKETETAAVVDATHPFAAQISRYAHAAAGRADIPYLRLERPAWIAAPQDRWISAASINAAVDALPESARVFLTVGRKGVEPFMGRKDLGGIIRSIEPPAVPLGPRWQLVLARPPFPVEDECSALQQNAITHLVTKNAGGALTEAKLLAARALSLPVVMIERPEKPVVQSYADAAQICSALRRHFGP
jgi:precorrin-6A/cobalt-precorrin-6A reductase